MLYRKIAHSLEAYFKEQSNKVLIINGARQIGKTYIIRHVGSQWFKNYIWMIKNKENIIHLPIYYIMFM